MIFTEMLWEEDPLGGSEGNDHVHEVFFFIFLSKIDFLTLIVNIF